MLDLPASVPVLGKSTAPPRTLTRMTGHDLLHRRGEFARMERRVLTEYQVEPGYRIALEGGALLVLVGLALPQVPGVHGWDLFRASSLVALGHVFLGVAAAFGVVTTLIAVVTKRWVLAWVSFAGCALASTLGLFTFWEQHTDFRAPGVPDAEPGLPFTWVAVMIVTLLWVPVMLRRPSLLERRGLH